MKCACVYVEDEGGSEFIKETYPVARKEHRCTECSCTIGIGDKYAREEGVWDGKFTTYKTCFSCLSLREEFFCDGWIYTHLWQDISEFINDCGGDIGDDRLTSLEPAALIKIGDILKIYNDRIANDHK